MNKSILVGIDGSEYSLHALQEVISLAKKLDAVLTLVNVQPSFNTIHTRLFFSHETIKDYQHQLSQEALNPAVELLQEEEMEYETVVRIGEPKHEICELADKMKADYIVLGSRGMGPVKGQILGSVSYGVLHDSISPVIIVPLNNKNNQTNKTIKRFSEYV
ncbi:universal stress protein [Bacillus taeanensis]|nr:universal stress protein [Bacillus taeanensis]